MMVMILLVSSLLWFSVTGSSYPIEQYRLVQYHHHNSIGSSLYNSVVDRMIMHVALCVLFGIFLRSDRIRPLLTHSLLVIIPCYLAWVVHSGG